MATSFEWVKTVLWALCMAGAAACTEGPVYTLGSKPSPRDAEPDVPVDAGPETGPEAGSDAGLDAGSDAGPDAGPGGQPWEFDPDTAHPLEALNSIEDDENPTLCDGEKQIYFSSERGDSSDVYFALLESANTFGAPELVEAANSEEFETSPAISSDCNTLWIGTNFGTEDVDIYELVRGATGEFGMPAPVDTVLSDFDDIPRPPGGPGELTMPMASRRETRFDNAYQTFFAYRVDANADFEQPDLIRDLAVGGTNFDDAFLTADGLTLLFHREGDLWFSTRDSLVSTWSEAALILGVSTADREQDPWLSPDGQRLYFTRAVEGRGLDIFQIDRVPAP